MWHAFFFWWVVVRVMVMVRVMVRVMVMVMVMVMVRVRVMVLGMVPDCAIWRLTALFYMLPSLPTLASTASHIEPSP